MCRFGGVRNPDALVSVASWANPIESMLDLLPQLKPKLGALLTFFMENQTKFGLSNSS